MLIHKMNIFIDEEKYSEAYNVLGDLKKTTKISKIKDYTQPTFDALDNFLRDKLAMSLIFPENSSKKKEAQVASSIPSETSLGPNYPNPFNPATTITFQLSAISNVTLKVYDILGREVATLADGIVEAGKHEATFDGSNLASGIYFARLVVTQDNNKPFVQVRKLMMLK